MQWPPPLGCSGGRQGATILTKFKLLNVISDQLMDCNVIIDHYRHIAVHKLYQYYVEKLKFGWSNSPIVAHVISDFGQILPQWTVVVIIISSKCQLFIPKMLWKSKSAGNV